MTDGGLSEVYAVCPDVSDAGPAVELDGGFWLPHPRGARLACKLAGCEEYVAHVDRSVPTFSYESVALAVVMGVLWGLAGLYFGWAFARWMDGK